MIKLYDINALVAPAAQKIRHDYLEPLFAAWFGAFVLSAALFGLVQVTWVLALVLTVPLAALLGYLMIAMDRAFIDQQPTRINVAILVFAILLAALVCAWWSYLLSRGNSTLYSLAPHINEPLTPGRFFNLYMMTFIDLIPGIRAADTLKYEPAITYKSWIAGLPLLAFRAIVVFRILLSIKHFFRSTPASGISAAVA